MNSELSSRSEGRSLRMLQRVDYKKISKCEVQAQGEIGEFEAVETIYSRIREHLDNPSGAYVLSPSSGLPEPVSGIIFLRLTLTKNRTFSLLRRTIYIFCFVFDNEVFEFVCFGVLLCYLMAD